MRVEQRDSGKQWEGFHDPTGRTYTGVLKKWDRVYKKVPVLEIELEHHPIDWSDIVAPGDDISTFAVCIYGISRDIPYAKFNAIRSEIATLHDPHEEQFGHRFLQRAAVRRTWMRACIRTTRFGECEMRRLQHRHWLSAHYRRRSRPGTLRACRIDYHCCRFVCRKERLKRTWEPKASSSAGYLLFTATAKAVWPWAKKSLIMTGRYLGRSCQTRKEQRWTRITISLG